MGSPGGVFVTYSTIWTLSQRVCECVFVAPWAVPTGAILLQGRLTTDHVALTGAPQGARETTLRFLSLLARQILALFPSFPFFFHLGDYSSPFSLIDIQAPTPLGSAERFPLPAPAPTVLLFSIPGLTLSLWDLPP